MWRFRGVVLDAPSPVAWAVSHAALPMVDERLRLYFSSRDEKGRARIGRGALDLKRGKVEVEREPVLDLGPVGAFDADGVTGSCIVEHMGRLLLYYSGWTRGGGSTPFAFFAGCAVSNDDGASFARASAAPILERSDVDPFLTASPWVVVEDGTWRMWYVSCTGWETVVGEPRHRYHIKYAESRDGLSWHRSGRVCIDYRDEREYAISRPCVVRDGDCYRMWYASRGDAYRIGYAESPDGLEWTRLDDEAGLEPSGESWDAEMQAYPLVFDRAGARHMLYNGNGYGATGIGHAVLEP